MHFKMSSAICFNLDQSKILSSGNELILYQFAKFGPNLKQIADKIKCTGRSIEDICLS